MLVRGFQHDFGHFFFVQKSTGPGADPSVKAQARAPASARPLANWARPSDPMHFRS